MTGDVGLSVLSESLGEGVFEFTVLMLESADPVGGGLEPPKQRGLGSALPLGRRDG